MQSKVTEIIYDVILQPGEELTLPQEAAGILGPGHWTVSIRPASEDTPRNHAAFLNSYTSEDEGLYDDYSAG
jgi:hypothetical protein